MSTNADRADRPDCAVIVQGEFADLLPRLFGLEDGHLRFGPARSRDPAETREVLSNWCIFDDYVMEGFVRYSLRADHTSVDFCWKFNSPAPGLIASSILSSALISGGPGFPVAMRISLTSLGSDSQCRGAPGFSHGRPRRRAMAEGSEYPRTNASVP